MPPPHRWHGRMLYCVFVGMTDREGQILERRRFRGAIIEFTERMKQRRDGGVTWVGTMHAEGDTVRWGREPSTLILILTDDEQAADVVIEESEDWLVTAFVQDEIWICKRPLSLFIAASRPNA